MILAFFVSLAAIVLLARLFASMIVYALPLYCAALSAMYAWQHKLGSLAQAADRCSDGFCPVGRRQTPGRQQVNGSPRRRQPCLCRSRSLRRISRRAGHLGRLCSRGHGLHRRRSGRCLVLWGCCPEAAARGPIGLKARPARLADHCWQRCRSWPEKGQVRSGRCSTPRVIGNRLGAMWQTSCLPVDCQRLSSGRLGGLLPSRPCKRARGGGWRDQSLLDQEGSAQLAPCPGNRPPSTTVNRQSPFRVPPRPVRSSPWPWLAGMALPHPTLPQWLLANFLPLPLRGIPRADKKDWRTAILR